MITILLSIIVVVILIAIIWSIVEPILKTIASFFVFAGHLIQILVISAIVALLVVIIWSIVSELKANKSMKDHKESHLSYEQIKTIAHNRALSYIKNHYIFYSKVSSQNSIDPSSLNPEGQWDSIHFSTKEFPAIVARMLKNKHHEWVVVAIEKEGYIVRFWANKGLDANSGYLTCSVQDLIKECKAIGGYTLFRFHNHPNPNPQKYTTLIASETDIESAKSYANAVCKEGINWYDFVCSGDRFIQFYSAVAIEFEVDNNRTSDIIDVYGITPELDLPFIEEYYSKKRGKIKIGRVYLAVLIVVSIVFFTSNYLYENSFNVFESTNVVKTREVEEDAEISISDVDNQTEPTVITVTNPQQHSSDTDDSLLLSSGSRRSHDVRYSAVMYDEMLYEYNSALDGYVLTDGPNITDIVIPSAVAGIPVVAIGESAFLFHDELNTITLPDSIVVIKQSAFNGCNSLTEISFGTGLTTIEDRAFEFCDFVDIVIPEGVTSIGEHAFHGCGNLESIILPESLCAIGNSCFQSCGALETITIPSSVTLLGGSTFAQCSNLEEIYIPSSCCIEVESDGSFADCDAIIIEY